MWDLTLFRNFIPHELTQNNLGYQTNNVSVAKSQKTKDDTCEHHQDKGNKVIG